MRVKEGKRKSWQCFAWASAANAIVLVMLLSVSLHSRAEQGPVVAAASSLRSVWPDLIASYTKTSENAAPRVSFASSGLLSTQIINGAPFELFLSADRQSIERLPKALLATAPQVYAVGQMHLVVPATSALRNNLSLESVAALLRTSETPLRIAIPNPAHAPYGRAAKEALSSSGIWPVPAQQLLAAENAAQTLQFVRSGAVDVAIVPQSLVYAYQTGIVSALLPADSYQAVEHTIASMHNASAAAQTFLNWMLSEQALTVLEASGLHAPCNRSQTAECL